MAQLTIALLGPLQVMLNGITLTSFGYDKVRALLAYIAVEGARPLSRTTLAELLWPDQPSGVARTNLRHALAVLRRAIGDSSAPPFLLVNRETLQLNPIADCTIDVTVFTNLISDCTSCDHPGGAICAACADRLTQALVLYRGDFMALFSLPDSVDFDEWSLVLRERLHEQAADALALLTAYHQAHSEQATARELAKRWAQHSRWDEQAHRCLMRLYAQAGQRGAALAQYERCRRMLVDELGITPAAETVALYEAIRSGQLRESGTAREGNPAERTRASAKHGAQAGEQNPAAHSRRLPILPNALIGRERELAELVTLLRKPTTRLVTLTGSPGIGKTRLALATAHALASDNSFPDGVFFVPLAPIRDATLIGTAIIRALELIEVNERPASVILASFFHTKHALLVLDNLEQIVAAAPTLAELLAAAPGLALLITSRVLLHLSSEQEYLLGPLGLPGKSNRANQALYGYPNSHSPSAPILPLTEISSAPAVQLFVARAKAAWAGFAMDKENGGAIAALCVRLDGLPLAIELAAVRARMLRPPELLERLYADGGLDTLGHGPLDAPARQQTLRHAIAWSYDLLSPAAQTVFRRLGLFVGGWSLDAAEYICGMAVDESILDLVGALIDHSLVQVVEAPGGELRFSMLETLREFALEQLASTKPSELEQTRQCHAKYFSMLAQILEQRIYTAEDVAALRQLESEASNLRDVLAWALADGSTQAELALWPVRGLFWLWSHHGPVTEGRIWLARALDATIGNPQTYPRILVLLSAGWLASFSDDITTAERLATEALTCAREYGQAGLVFGALWLLSDIRLASDLECAAALADEGLALAPELDACHHGIALFHCASIAMYADDMQRSLSLLEESLVYLRRVGALFWLGEALMCLAIVLRFQGEAVQARAHAEECLALMRQLGSRRHILVMLRNLVLLARIAGDYAAAEAYANELLAQAHDLGEPGMIAEDSVYAAIVKFEQGEFAPAQELADQSLARAYEAHSPVAIAMARWIQGMLALAHGDVPTADCVTECLKQAQISHADWPLLLAHSLAGLAASAQGEHATACRLLEARLALREARINRWERAEGLADLGQALLNAGEIPQSAACLKEALSIYRVYGSKQRIERTIEALAQAQNR